MNFIDGIAISNYRSFGDKPQKIGPFSKINIFIGKNNSGKSNILRFLKQYNTECWNYVQTQREFDYKDKTDIHLGLTKDNICLGYGVDISDFDVDEYNKNKLSDILSPRSKSTLSRIVQYLNSYGEGMLWILFQGGTRNSINNESIDLIHSMQHNLNIPSQSKSKLLFALTGRSGGNEDDQTIEILRKFILSLNNKPAVTMISAMRQIARDGSINDSEFNGVGLITELAKYQDPEHDEIDKRQKFLKIEKFLQTITRCCNARISIPYSRNYVQVDIDGNGNFLPLESLGTGIHEIVLLASACTIFDDQIICLEEPELHFHPQLQKEFLLYIAENTNNQYFISTHSAHLLNSPGTSIFHVTIENGDTKVSNAYKISEKLSICQDLGYQPSDLFQTNSIIWVEGPSDRIYLNYWIKSFDPDLIEGLHYSIMFYGGKLLSHLTPSQDESVDDFISLRKLNQQLMIVMDSDISPKRQGINSTKERIKKEFVESPDLAWVTKGREIENYLNPDILFEAVYECHPRKGVTKLEGQDQFECVTKFVKNDGESETYDKLRVALKYIEIEEQPDYSALDLEKKIKIITKFIRESNQLPLTD